MSRIVTVDKGADASTPAWIATGAVYPILISISFCHLLNDLIQSLLPAIYPILKTSYHLDFGQVGMITLCNQL
ncbi:MAG TPA: hypothetical protein VHA14_20630, partial [Bryobacteraceae bacterium]|nr:hypothetical protein [Bryobacteraceae bacterium]